MLTPTLCVWLSASLVTGILHIGTAILIDGRVRLGTWGKLGLALFTLLGPLGTLLELWLLTMVLRDIYRLHRTAPAGTICTDACLAGSGQGTFDAPGYDGS